MITFGRGDGPGAQWWAAKDAASEAIAAAGGDGHAVRLWDTNTGKKIADLNGHTGWVESTVFAPGGRTLATSSGDATVWLWDVATGRPILATAR